MNTRRDYAKFGRSIIAALTLGVVLMFVAVPRSHADDRANCQQRIENTEAKLQQEIREHGEHSPQADNRRRELNNERERCWNEQHGWWNGRDHQWHNERDWDRDYDKDRGRDNPAYQSGYNEGLKFGRYDLSKNRAYQPGNYKAYKNGDETYRRGFMAGYDEGFGRRGRNTVPDQWRDRGGYQSNPAYQSGYNEGLKFGRYDLSKNRAYQPGNYKAYKNGDETYRRGFMAGYDEGFGRGR
jgi:hypothetical protein